MGMVAEWVRMSPAELERAAADPVWAEEFVDELLDDDEEDLTKRARRGFDVDKSWDALHVLLDKVTGVRPCPFLGGTEFGDVWSYDRPRILTATEVGDIATVLTATPFAALLEAYDAETLQAAYFGPWSAEDVALLHEFYGGLVKHFALAASRGEGMITYLS
jgi:hypothetical protein